MIWLLLLLALVLYPVVGSLIGVMLVKLFHFAPDQGVLVVRGCAILWPAFPLVALYQTYLWVGERIGGWLL